MKKYFVKYLHRVDGTICSDSMIFNEQEIFDPDASLCIGKIKSAIKEIDGVKPEVIELIIPL